MKVSGSFSRYGTGQESKKCTLMCQFIHIERHLSTFIGENLSILTATPLYLCCTNLFKE